MDRLERFVKDHREEFDIYDPDPDLWNRIKHSDHQNKYRVAFWWKAAIILIIFGASYLAHLHFSKTTPFVAKQDNTDLALPELRETEKYYNGLIQTKLIEVQHVLASYPGLKNDLHRDLAELDSIYKDLKKDLKDNVSNQEVIEAMIQNYRLKLELLEQIQQELQHPNDNKKNQSHEL